MKMITMKSRIKIMKALLAVTACCAIVSVARASDPNAEFNRWFEMQTNLQSWSGDFTQTRTLTVLNQPLVSAGKV